MKNLEEMKLAIANWKKSRKYLEFQELLKAKKQELIELKFEIMISKDEYYTRDELVALINAIKLSEEIECEVDYDYNYFSILGTQEEILAEYISKLSEWFMYLKIYIYKEEFEICAGIRDVIEIEKNTFYDICLRYRGEDQEFLDKIISLPDEIYEKIF